MANDLTGDFDVVAEFTLGAADRVLAAMHSGGRLPHSWSLRVDDFEFHVNPHVRPNKVTGVRSVVDPYGEPVTDPVAVARVPLGSASQTSPQAPPSPVTDIPVNLPKTSVSPTDQFTGAALYSHIEDSAKGVQGIGGLLYPKHLVGVAQLQLGAPTISLVQNSSHSVTVHTPVMAYYTGDIDTLDIPTFLRGEFQTTIAVQEASSNAGRSIDVVLAGKTGNAQFVPNWTNPSWDPKNNADDADRLAAINKAVVNSLMSSFEPSSTPLPSNVVNLKFKAIGGDSPALAMLMDLPGGNPSGPPDPNSVWQVLLGDGDDFAFAVSDEFVQTMFAQSVNDLKRWPFSFSYEIDVKIDNPFSGLFGPDNYTIKVTTITFTISLDSGTVALQDGQILVTVTGSANTDTSGVPKFSFTATQALSLELINSAWGSTADLVALGDPSVDASAPGIPDWAINNYFKPNAVANFTTAITNFLNDINPGLQRKLSARENLGNFLTQLMNPAPKPGDLPVDTITPTLNYTGFEISSSGIVLHGTLALPAWHKPHVEFSFRMRPGWAPFHLASGEYNALRSWIPGGRIHEFVWYQQDGPPIHDDKHTFVFQEKAGAGEIIHLCLTIKGTRLTASGPIAYQPVSSTSFCAWRIRVFAQPVNRILSPNARIALTQRSPSGGLQVVGHMSPWAQVGTAPQYTSNLIIHFPDQESLARLESLAQALQQSGREDTASAIVAVLSPQEFAHVKPVEGISFSDDSDAWSQIAEFQHRPATFILGTNGEIVWHHEGRLGVAELAEAFRQYLVSGANSAACLLTSNVRVGQLPPNFLFESSPGRQLTLRRLVGCEIVLLFWSNSSAVSIETVREIEEAFANAEDQGPVVLAISEAGTAESAARIAAENGVTSTIVSDPTGEIAAAYGITIWPTVVFIDARGLVGGVRYGRFSTEVRNPAPGATAAD